MESLRKWFNLRVLRDHQDQDQDQGHPQGEAYGQGPDQGGRHGLGQEPELVLEITAVAVCA
jgi:hypothetical protein